MGIRFIKLQIKETLRKSGKCKNLFPEIKILALTFHESDQYVLEAFDARADGYCLKDAGRNELLVSIDNVLQGKRYISPSISDNVLEGYYGKIKIKYDLISF